MTPDQRKQALCLYKSLLKAEEMVKNGVVNAEDISKAVSDIITSHEETAIDYISICDPETLEPIQKIEDSALIALAVKVGKTRLIDNMLLSVNSQQ
jgi:pantoate--beta-alanine ligase